MNTVLQRVRFSTLSPAGYENEAYFKHPDFNRARWESKGRSCYWQSPGSAPTALHQPSGVTLAADERLCSDSYFNAFFLAYWQKLTDVRTFGLRLRFSGKLRIRVLGHNALAETETLLDVQAHHTEESAWSSEIPLPPGPRAIIRLSFAITALSKPATLSGGEWYTTDAPVRPVRAAIIIPTYNRASFARKTVTALLADSAVESAISQVVLIEQSDKPELSDLAGPKCSYVRQGNLGGAGGFARGMYECALQNSMGDLTHLLFMDDDIMIETDAVLRAIRMASYTREKVVLGGGMLDLFKPNVAVALGESNEKGELGYFSMKQDYPMPDMSSGKTLNMASLPQAVGYCAWWFCFVPIETVRKIGLPLPCFFRGDDIQWGVRAREAGFEPYLVPGIGLWHLPFYSKSLPWVTYFDRYNALVGNALKGGAEIDSFFAYSIYEIKVLLAKKTYAYAAAAIHALENYLRGWEHYRDRVFPTFLADVKAGLAPFTADNTPQALARLKAAADPLEGKITHLIARYKATGAKIQQDFACKMPQVYARQAWSGYFERGTMAGLE